jgi:diguanylate cyclase (GGDEF)-like protein/PAS domain S-box-containing protein
MPHRSTTSPPYHLSLGHDGLLTAIDPGIGLGDDAIGHAPGDLFAIADPDGLSAALAAATIAGDGRSVPLPPFRLAGGDGCRTFAAAAEATGDGWQIRLRPWPADGETVLDAAILDQMLAALIVTDLQGTVIVWNRHAEALFGWSREEAFGQPISILTIGPQDADVAAEIMSRLGAGQSWDGDFPVHCKDGETRWLRVSDTPIYDADGRLVAIAGVSLDLTPQKTIEADLEHRAFHDTVTGLPNRAHFARALESALSRDGAGGQVAVILFDLDRFKSVNDLLGHARGDEVLIAAATRLRQAFGSGMTIARIGGDEFAAMLEHSSEIEAHAIAEEAQSVLAQPLERAGWAFHLRASVGIALGRPGSTPHDLLRAADMALYQAKADGGGAIRVQEDGQRGNPERWFALEADLRRALIAGGEFVPYFQPIVDLASGRPVAVETQVRWRHPGLGLLAPSVFLPLAVEVGLIEELGAWTFRQACLQARAWADRFGDAAPIVDVELHSHQVRAPGLAAALHQNLLRTGLDPARIRLEVTERAVVDDLRTAAPVLRDLRATGMRLAIDEFGEGAPLLAVLGDIDVDMLRFDRDFGHALNGNRRLRAVVRALASLAHELDCQVTMVGIATDAERAAAAALGCDAGQGPVFAEAMPATQADAWLAAALR